MLTFKNIKDDLYRLSGTTSTSARTDIIEAVRLAILKGQQRFQLHGDWSFLNQWQDTVYIALGAPYTTGTIIVTQDSKTVTGTDTVWTNDMVGSYIQLTNQENYEIRSVESPTSLTLCIPYQGDTITTADTYAINKRFYPLPLDYMRPVARQAYLTQPGYLNVWTLDYNEDAAFSDYIQTNKPQWFSIIGNTKTVDYYNTSTVTIATTGTVSTWTIASGTLPTDIVDREVRISGEDRSYRIKTRSSATEFITYETYVNPSTQLYTQLTASNYAITPKPTMLIAFSTIPDQRYIFNMPYIKRLSEMLLDADVSPISSAGYDQALLALCRAELAKDARTAMNMDTVQNLVGDAEAALAEAWAAEQYAETIKLQSHGTRVSRSQTGPSWISEN